MKTNNSKMVKTDKVEIKKGSAKFIRAYDTSAQINGWCDENPDAIGIAFVGRSNVGKSSLINTLFGGKTAKTSKTPGRTQKINIFTFELTKDSTYKKYFLFDLPGYGHAQVHKTMSKNWVIMMDAFFQTIRGRTLLINLQDARHPNQDMDKKFYDYINPKLVDIFLVFNKIDKLKRQKERAALNKLKPSLYEAHKHVKNIFFASAEKREGVEPLEQEIVSYLKKIRDADDKENKLLGIE